MLDMKRRKGKYKDADEYNKIGRDFREVLSNYNKYNTKTEHYLFIGIPLILSFIIFTYFYFFELSNTQLLNYIIEMNQMSLTVIAILAGFNTTSLSIIAASNNEILVFLKKNNFQNNRDSVLKQLVTFFTFAILIQLMILAIGVVISITSNNFIDITTVLPFIKGGFARILLSVFGILWLSAVLFTIIISIRNATLLYRYVLFIANYNDK